MSSLSGINISVAFCSTDSPTEKKFERQLSKFTKLGFAKEVGERCPDCMDFLFHSRAIYRIAMFKNSTAKGADEHAFRIGEDGHPLLKMQGKWQRWDEVKKLITYDKVSEKLVSKDNPSIVWTYISPDGFVQNDPYEYQNLYPIETLLPEEHQAVREQAKKFVFPKEVDPGEEKECVLQLFTTKREAVPRNWLTENFLDHAIEHPGLRIIDKEGRVYSFGAVMPRREAREIEQSWAILTAGTFRVRACDIEESFKFDERRVTSIPLTSARVEKILEFASQINKTADRPFQLLRQNCVKFASIILDKAGVEVNTRTKADEFLSYLAPDMKKVPILGTLIEVVQSVTRCVTPLFQTLYSWIPTPITQVLSLANTGLSFIERKLWLLFWGVVSVAVFGSTKTKCHTGACQTPAMNDRELISFQRLITSWEDLFEEGRLDLYYSARLVDWQCQQASTKIHLYEGKPKLYL